MRSRSTLLGQDPWGQPAGFCSCSIEQAQKPTCPVATLGRMGGVVAPCGRWGGVVARSGNEETVKVCVAMIRCWGNRRYRIHVYCRKGEGGKIWPRFGGAEMVTVHVGITSGRGGKVPRSMREKGSLVLIPGRMR